MAACISLEAVQEADEHSGHVDMVVFQYGCFMVAEADHVDLVDIRGEYGFGFFECGVDFTVRVAGIVSPGVPFQVAGQDTAEYVAIDEDSGLVALRAVEVTGE